MFASPMRGLLSVALLSLACASAQSVYAQAIDPAKSSVRFFTKQMGVGVEGSFRTLQGQVVWDDKKPEASRATVEVDLGSVDIGQPEVNEEAKGKSFFNVLQFPKASFVSSKVRQLASGRFEAIGQLSVKGIVKEIAVPFTVKQDGTLRVYDGEFLLKRLDFKVGDGAWSDTDTVANEVVVRLRLVTPGR
jgi:polyisoprenoid-binding protein YceI